MQAEKAVESSSKMEVAIFCNQITEITITSHQLCLFYWLESNHYVQPILKGRLHKAVNTRIQDYREPF